MTQSVAKLSGEPSLAGALGAVLRPAVSAWPFVPPFGLPPHARLSRPYTPVVHLAHRMRACASGTAPHIPGVRSLPHPDRPLDDKAWPAIPADRRGRMNLRGARLPGNSVCGAHDSGEP